MGSARFFSVFDNSVPCGTALMENYLKGFCHGKVELLLEVLVLDFIILNA